MSAPFPQPLSRTAELRLLDGLRHPLPRDVQHQLVLTNMRLVPIIAQRLRRSTVSWEDLIAEGMRGLLRAAQKFDPGRGVRFNTYATEWILHFLRKAIHQQARIVRMPWGSVSLAFTVTRPTDVPYEVRAVASRHEDDDPEVWNDRLDARAQARRIDLSELTMAERIVIKHRFGIGGYEVRSLDAIGAELGYCRENVRQIEKRALRKLREQVGAARASGALGTSGTDAGVLAQTG